MENKRLLKIILIEAKLEKSGEKKPSRASKLSTYHATVDVTNFQGNPIGGDYSYQTKALPDLPPVWNQTCIFSIPAGGINFSHKAIQIKVWCGSKIIGFSQQIQIASIASNGLESKWYQLEGKNNPPSVHLKIGWYGAKSDNAAKQTQTASPSRVAIRSTSVRNNILPDRTRGLDRASTIAPSNTSSSSTSSVPEGTVRVQMEFERIINDAVTRAVESKNTEISKLAQEVNELKTQLDTKADRVVKLESSLKKYRDVDDEARKLVGAGIDWREVRVQARQLERRTTQAHRVNPKANLLDDDSPRAYAEYLLGNKELHHVNTLKKKLTLSDAKWLKQFLVADGLENIYRVLKSVEQEEDIMTTQMSLKQATLSSCIKILLNNQASCEFVIRSQVPIMKDIISLVLTSKNNLMRAQMCHLFAALCIYGRTAHDLVADSVQFIGKNTKPFHYVLQLLIDERDRALIASIMGLINALLAGEKELGARMKLRANMTDSDLLIIMDEIREELPDERPLLTQISAFESMASKDEEDLRDLRFIGNLDLFNPHSIFNQVKLQTESAGIDATDLFVRHLQHLLLIPHTTNNPLSIWRFIERASRRATSTNEAKALSNITPHEINKEVYKIFKREEELARKEGRPKWQRAVVSVALPAPDQSQIEDKLIPVSPKSPPAPPEQSIQKSAPFPQQQRVKRPRAVNKLANSKGGKTPVAPEAPQFKSDKILPEAEAPIEANLKDNILDLVPEPQRKMKPFFWDTTQSDSEYWKDAMPELETIDTMFQEIQGIFYAPKGKTSKKKKISLLPVRLSNNISILRTQFKQTDDEIVSLLFDITSNSNILDTHHFEAILNCIPEDEQILLPLLEYDGPVEDLEKPDRFLWTLLGVPGIKNKLKAMIYWDEFDLRIATINNSLEVMSKACSDILASKKLKSILGIILSVGNFLNSGTARGRARAIQPPTLKKLNEMRSTVDPKLTLLTYLAGFVETNFSELVNFTKEIESLEEAMRYQPEILHEEVAVLEQGLYFLEGILNVPDEEKVDYFQFYDALNTFAGVARFELDRIEEKFSAFGNQASVVLRTFGQEPTTPIEQLWGNFYEFSKQFKNAINEMRRKKEEEETRSKMNFGMSFRNQDDYEEESTSELMTNDEDDETPGLMDKLIAAIKEGIFSYEEIKEIQPEE